MTKNKTLVIFHITKSICLLTSYEHINPLRPVKPYMQKTIGSSLVQVKAYHLFGTKPLSKPLKSHSQLEPKEQDL